MNLISCPLNLKFQYSLCPNLEILRLYIQIIFRKDLVTYLRLSQGDNLCYIPTTFLNLSTHLILGVLENNAKERYLLKQFWSYYSVIRCQPRLYAPAGGSKRCTMDNMYGSECSFTCQPGHIMRGSAKRSCEKNQTSSFGFWTGNETKCECKLYQFHLI